MIRTFYFKFTFRRKPPRSRIKRLNYHHNLRITLSIKINAVTAWCRYYYYRLMHQLKNQNCLKNQTLNKKISSFTKLSAYCFYFKGKLVPVIKSIKIDCFLSKCHSYRGNHHIECIIASSHLIIPQSLSAMIILSSIVHSWPRKSCAWLPEMRMLNSIHLVKKML